MADGFEELDESDSESINYAVATNADDDPIYWDIVVDLQRRGTRSIVKKMLELCDSQSEPKQQFGLNVLSQLGFQTGERFIEESLPTALRLCQQTTSPKVLNSGISALGWFRDPSALSTVLQFTHHPDEEVRHSVVHALPKLVGESANPALIDALIELMVDESALIRDWATYGLGTTLHSDSPEIRAALWLRVDDEDPETVFEALRGLGKRRVPGVVDRIVEVLSRRPISSYYVDAAVEMPDRRLVKPLELIFATEFDEDITGEWLTEVISDCADATFEEIG